MYKFIYLFVCALFLASTVHGQFVIKDNNNVPMMTVTETGNVGIGVALPTQTLHMSGGDARIHATSIGHSEFIHISGSNLIGGVYAPPDFPPPVPGQSPIHIRTSDTSPILLVENGGNVGMGQASPTSKLDIIGYKGNEQLRLQTSYTPPASSDQNGNTGNLTWDDNYLYLKTGSGWKRAVLTTF